MCERLAAVGAEIRGWMLATAFPERLQTEVLEAWRKMQGTSDAAEFAVAVRSSATAEDLPEASFAGQQETFLNVRGEEHLLKSMHEVYASLFNDRAISYRVHNKFDHSAVALSVGVQHMVRSDLGAAGVMFTLDTDSGFRDVVFITAAYGLGETVVQGAVNPDEFYVYKPALRAGRRAIVQEEPRRQGDQDDLRRSRAPRSACVPSTWRLPTASIFASSEADITELAQAGAHHRGTLRHAHGHRVGQGRRHRQDLHPASASGDRAKPSRPHDIALHAEIALQGARPAAAASASASAPAMRASSRTRKKCRGSEPATFWSPT